MLNLLNSQPPLGMRDIDKSDLWEVGIPYDWSRSAKKWARSNQASLSISPGEHWHTAYYRKYGKSAPKGRCYFQPKVDE